MQDGNTGRQASASSLDDCRQSGSKAAKSIDHGSVLDVNLEPLDEHESVAPASSQEGMDCCSHVAEVLEPRGPLHDADRHLIRFSGGLHQAGTIRSTFVGHELEVCSFIVRFKG